MWFRLPQDEEFIVYMCACVHVGGRVCLLASLCVFDLISSAPCLWTACCFQHTGAILVVSGHASAVLEFWEHASAVLVFWGHTSFRAYQSNTGIFTIIPVNMPDPIWKHFWLWPVCSQNWAGMYMLDLISHIWFGSILPKKKAWTILYKTSQDLTWMARSSFGQMRLVRNVRKHAGMHENHRGPVLVEHKQPATSFPLSDSVAFFHRLLRMWDHKFVQNPPGSNLVLADCQVWAKWIQSGSKPVCKNHQAHFWPPLLSWSRLDANPIRHVYWDILHWYDFWYLYTDLSIAWWLLDNVGSKTVSEWATYMMDLVMDWKCLPLSVAVSAYHCSDVQHPLWAVQSQAVSLDGHHSGLPLSSHWSLGGASLVGLLPLRHNRPYILWDLCGESPRG